MAGSVASGIEYKALGVWDGDEEPGTGSGELDEDDDLNLGPASGTGTYRKSPLHRYVGLFTQNEQRQSLARRQHRKHNCKTYTVMGGFVLLFIGICVTISVMSSTDAAAKRARDKQLALRQIVPTANVSLNDVLVGKFSSTPFNGTWVSDDEIQYLSDKGDLVTFNVVSKETTILIPGLLLTAVLGMKSPGKCSLSTDKKFVLISYESQKIYRHSSYAKYLIYEIETRNFTPLLPAKLEMGHGLLQLAEWSPVGNALIFVYANNLYYKTSALAAESTKLTSDGSSLVYNGVTDWVYEEEMFGSDKAVWFSPNGQNLAFVTFNDTSVDLIQYPVYGDPGLPDYQYPMLEAIPYPKTGRHNPTAKVSVINLPKEGSTQFKLFRDLQFPQVPQEHYVGTALWATASELLVVTLNRQQNDSRHHLCDMRGRCETILLDQVSGGWIDIEVPKVSADGRRFLTLTSQKQEGSVAYRHILLYTSDATQRPITSGLFSVDSILGYDEKNKRIYFTAPAYNFSTKTATPSQMHLYYMSDSALPSDAVCVSCNTVNSFNQSCLYNTFEMSKEYGRTTKSCSSPENVQEITIENLKTFEVEETWVHNDEVRSALAKVRLPIIRDYDIPLPSGFVIKARLEMPGTFNQASKYPMLVDVYGGPGSQKISDSYGIDWATSLITSHGVIYASIDGRGSGRQSDDLKFQLNRRLGTVEIQDQIFAADWLIQNVGFIDATRTAIWGWSYGGYSTAMVMGTDYRGIYKCGISVAPVTNWLFYDTIYTERYMGLPSSNDNFPAYNRSDVTNYVDNFRTKKYYLIHGNADDNVHYQQSMVLSRALEKADILFRQQSYPDENHGLGGVRKHLYHSLENFLFTQCF